VGKIKKLNKTFSPLPRAFRVLSWGVGMQSTVLGVKSALGQLERLDAIITADTLWERRATYEVRDFYMRWFADHDLPVYIVSAGSVLEQGAREHVHIPFWTANGGPLGRQCTVHFKIEPIRRKTRELLGLHPSNPPHPKKNAVESWVGFSMDELQRAKGSDVAYICQRWPLLEHTMSRQDCERFLIGLGLPIPVKSACIGCPYRSALDWVEMAEQAPEEFEQACKFDEENRHNPLKSDGSTETALYIFKDAGGHPRPLREAFLDGTLQRMAERQRRAARDQLALFDLADAMCGEGVCMV
jgi:hypothetical protein